MRSFPEYDLALIRTQLTVPYIRDMTLENAIAPETPLIADDYTEAEALGMVRPVKRPLPEGWFVTTFSEENVTPAFIGAPIMDQRPGEFKGDLVGMLTRNAGKNSGYWYGLHVTMIRRKVEEYYAELRRMPNALYCGSCGSLSKAGSDGLYYCETCGALFPQYEKIPRHPHPRGALYYDDADD